TKSASADSHHTGKRKDPGLVATSSAGASERVVQCARPRMWDPDGRRECPMSAPYHDIIALEAGKRSGQPTIRGMRITVADVLSYLAAGMTHQEILDDFPYLTKEDILACLSYAADRERRVVVVHV